MGQLGVHADGRAAEAAHGLDEAGHRPAGRSPEQGGAQGPRPVGEQMPEHVGHEHDPQAHLQGARGDARQQGHAQQGTGDGAQEQQPEIGQAVMAAELPAQDGGQGDADDAGDEGGRLDVRDQQDDGQGEDARPQAADAVDDTTQGPARETDEE